MAERSRLVDDPLNLMRVMPPKEARAWPCVFPRMAFLLSDRINRMDKMSSEKSNGAGNSVDSVNSVEESDSDRINKVDKMVSERSDTSNSVDSVHSVENPLPNSKKIFVGGKLHPDIRVPFREITLAPTKTMNGEIEVNEPVRVYDTSGPWGDPSVTLDPVQGLPPLRQNWILKRGDVEPYEGREVKPIDDGWFSEKHATARNGSSKSQTSNRKFKRQILRAT